MLVVGGVQNDLLRYDMYPEATHIHELSLDVGLLGDELGSWLTNSKDTLSVDDEKKEKVCYSHNQTFFFMDYNEQLKTFNNLHVCTDCARMPNKKRMRKFSTSTEYIMRVTCSAFPKSFLHALNCTLYLHVVAAQSQLTPLPAEPPDTLLPK